MNDKIKNFDIRIEFLRILACISVIVIHVSDQIVLLQNSILNKNLWLVASFMESITRFAVPVFFMITGSLLIKKRSGGILKNLLRLIIIYIIWSLIYIIINSIAFNLKFSLKDLNELIFFNASYQLWYFKAAFIIYLVIPFINESILLYDKKFIKYFLIVWFLIIFALYFIDDVFKLGIITYSELQSPIMMIFSYTGWAVLGYYLKTYTPIKSKIVSFLVFIIGCVSTFGLRLYYLYNTKQWNGYVYSNFSLNLLLLSCGIFLLFVNINNEKMGLNLSNKNKIRIKKIGRLTLGAFLIHPLFILLIKSSNYLNYINVLKTMSILSYILELLFVLILSFIVTFILSKIPILKKIV